MNLYFEGPGTMIPRIERALTIDDNVLRSLTLAMDKSMIAHYRASKSASQAAVEKRGSNRKQRRRIKWLRKYI